MNLAEAIEVVERLRDGKRPSDKEREALDLVLSIVRVAGARRERKASCRDRRSA